MVVHTFNPSIQEAEAGWYLSLWPAGLQSKFQNIQGYTEKHCLEKLCMCVHTYTPADTHNEGMYKGKYNYQ